MSSPVKPFGDISSRIRWIGSDGPQARLDPNGFGAKSDADKIDVLHQQIDELAFYVTELAAEVDRLKNDPLG